MKKMTYKAYCDAMSEKGLKPMAKNDYEAMSDDEYEEKVGKGMGVTQGDGIAHASSMDEKPGEPQTMVKAQKAAEDLLKSIDAYSAVEEGVDPKAPRVAELEARIAAGTATSKDRMELGDLYKSEAHTALHNGDLRKSLAERMGADDEAAQLVDASPVFQALLDGFDATISDLSKGLAQESLVTRELQKAQGQLFKSVARVIAEQHEVIREQGALIKSLHDRVSHVEGQPAPRRARQATDGDILKGGPAAAPAQSRSNKLSKAQVRQALRVLTDQAADRGDDNALTNLGLATAEFEATGNLPQAAHAAVRQVLG